MSATKQQYRARLGNVMPSADALLAGAMSACRLQMSATKQQYRARLGNVMPSADVLLTGANVCLDITDVCKHNTDQDYTM